MEEIDLTKLQELYNTDLDLFYKKRDSLNREAIFFNDDSDLFMYDSLAKIFYRKKYLMLYRTLFELSILGYRFSWDDDWDNENINFQQLIKDEWVTIKQEDCSNLSVLSEINRAIFLCEPIVGNKPVMDEKQEEYDKQLTILLSNQFFIKHSNSVLIQNKLEGELPEKNIIQKILKI